MIGSKLGSYEVEEEIGRGGMGVVYRAYQPNLQRQVAVKVLLPHLARDEAFVERFMREARAAAKLHHPGLVTIFDVGELDGTYFFSMQWLQGKTLEEKLEEPGQLPLDEVVSVVTQMASALGYAHEAGVVHRDVKPANVIVDDMGRAVLTDFGIAQAANETRLTRVGASVGSPDYMAPEQISAGNIDARTDLYSLGVLFYHLLTGEPPYAGDAPIAVAYQHLNAPVPSARNKRPEVPPALDSIAQKLMAKEPDERFQSAEELMAALRDVSGVQVTGPPIDLGTVPISIGSEAVVETDETAGTGSRKSPLPRLVLAVVALALVGGGLYWGLSGGAREADSVDPIDEQGGEEVAPPPPAEPVEQVFTGTIAVEPDLPGLEIWLDGRDRQQVTPAVVALEGSVGDLRTLELRRDGEVLANRELTLGPELEARWAPELAPVEETFTISSEPAGAQVTLDGTVLDGVTPLEVDLVPDRTYTFRVTLDGHRPAGRELAIGDLTAEQRQTRSLHFPLAVTVVPGELVVLADYAVTIEVAGRQQSGEGEVRVAVPPGNHAVQLSAPQVFYGDSLAVALESGEERTIQLPQTVTIPVAAQGRCRLIIDGREVGDLPQRVELTVGQHLFRFEWEGGVSKEVPHTIGLSTERVFEVKP